MYKLISLAIFFLLALITIHIITIPKGSEPVLEKKICNEITFQPIEVDSYIYFICDKNTILKLDKVSINVLNQKKIDENFKFNLVQMGKFIGVVTNSGKVMLLSQDLATIWQSHPVKKIIHNIQYAENKILIRSGYYDLILVDMISGEKIWQLSFPNTLLHVVLDNKLERIVCAYGNERSKPPVLTLKTFQLEDSKILWQFPGQIADFPIHAINDYILFATINGTIYGIDVETSEIVFYFEPNKKIFDFFPLSDNYLAIISSNGKKNFTLLPLDKSKNTFETELETTFIGAYIIQNILFLVERSRFITVDINLGKILKTVKPGMILQSFKHRDGICIVYKKNFLDRYSHFSYFNSFGEIVWTCVDSAMFYAPIIQNSNDIVFCKNGKIYVMNILNTNNIGAPTNYR